MASGWVWRGSESTPSTVLTSVTCTKNFRRLREATVAIWANMSKTCAINKSFLYSQLAKKFQRVLKACAISSVLVDFGQSVTIWSLEIGVGRSGNSLYNFTIGNIELRQIRDHFLEQIWELFVSKSGIRKSIAVARAKSV